VALVPLTLWRLAETILGLEPGERHDPEQKDLRWGNRLKALGLAMVYAAIAVTAVQFALGSRTSSAAQNAGLSARLMRSTEGKALLVVIGLEGLRKKGMSKSRAAAISNSPGSSSRGGKSSGSSQISRSSGPGSGGNQSQKKAAGRKRARSPASGLPRRW
jgi:uncharacterized membrane protein YgcG